MLAAAVLLMALCVSAFAGLKSDESWGLNPADFRYDMSLYFSLADKNLEDLEKYEIGAFVDDECRGVAEKLTLSETESCLYMRIRSNEATGEKIEFLLRSKEEGDTATTVLKAVDGSDFEFKADTRVGMPSSPYEMTCFYNVAVITEGKGSVEFTDGLYAFDSELTLKAVAGEGYHFEAWSTGDTDETLSLTVEGDTEVTATFAPNIYKVVFSIDGEQVAEEEVACDAEIAAPEAPAKVGYSFAGWTDLPETMPAHDLEISGSYTINSYLLSFKVDNQVISEGQVEYGAPIQVPDTPEKEGYTFNGWGDVPETMPAHDIEMYSSYTINSYKLTFELDGESIFSEDVVYGSTIIAPSVPEKNGYKFEGWAELPSTMPAEDLTITGEYIPLTCKLTFKVDGEEISSADVLVGAPIEVPAAPEKEGYTFNGWGDVPETMPDHNVEIHATYTVNSYKLSFTLAGEEILSEEVTYGSSIIAPEAAEKIGYTFNGWGDVPATMPAKDLAFESDYTVNEYNVTYKVDGEVAFQQKVAYQAEVPVFNAPEKEGYEFGGFGEIPSVMPAKDLEFNGSYIVYKYNLTFRIGGDIISSNKIACGTEITAPEAPAKEGYKFTGWKNAPTTMPAHDVVVDGDYEIGKYTITYVVDNQTYKVEEYEYGATVVPLAEPTEVGHTFSGWGDIPATMPAFDMTIGGTFAENFYRVTFRLDGVVILTDDVVFDTAINAPEVPAKEGYTFNGWGEIPTSMPAYDLEFDSSYTVNTYNVTFKIGDEEIYKGVLAYGAEVVAPEAPAKEGHTFNGWGIVPDNMPASDLEIVGDYTVNSYALTYRIGEEDFFTTELPYGSKIEDLTVPAKEGHTFSGWTNLPETMPANNLVVAGVYNVNNYAITFSIGNEVLYKGEIPYGSEIIAPEAPVKEGHTFNGWGMVPATMPATDLEVLGDYSVNVYNVTFRIDGEDFFTTKLAYGSPVAVVDAPAKEGHSFSGWGDVVPTVPANDLVISGTYLVNNYNISFKIGEEVIFEGSLPYGATIEAPAAPAKEGHTFTGWGMVPATMPATDLALTGGYDVNVYTLVFDIDGEAFYTTQLAYGTEIKAPADKDVPEKEGNTFAGWGEIPATMPANDLVISGSYDPNPYQLIFKIGEEIFFAGLQPYGSEIVPPVPEREGYTFSGWGEVPATMPAHELVLSGDFTVNKYTYRFILDGKVVEEATVDYNTPLVAPEVDPMLGYTFSGWGVVPATMPAADTDFTGTYDVNYYNITFKVGEDVVYSDMIPYGSQVEVVEPEAPAKEGYTFEGWGGYPSEMPARDVVVNGKYIINTYTISFYIANNRVSTEKLEFGAPISVPEASEKEGYTFSGWGVVPETMPAKDLLFTGDYVVNTYAVVFKVGEEIISAAQAEYGSSIVAPEDPVKEGHTFLGWNEVPATVPAHDVEVNGSFSINTYNLTFKIGDEVLAQQVVEYGAEIVAPEASEKEGYTFSGWGIVPATMPASDLEFSGVYDVNYYNITFRINGELAYTSTLAYGAEITVPTAPESEGYTFDGWKDVPATMPAQDLEFDSKYTANPYQVTFMIGDDTITTISVAYGDKIETPEAPEKEGYTFTGWTDVPETMPAKDIVIKGEYEINKYLLIVYLNDVVFFEHMIEYGSPVEIPVPDVEAGMKFEGWQEEVPATMPAHDVEIHGSIVEDDPTGVDAVLTGDDITVLSLDGVVLFKNAKASDLKDRLTPGIYIINGKKMVIR